MNSTKEVKNIVELYNLSISENNNDVAMDCIKNCNNLLPIIKKTEIKCFLSEENDSLDCYLEVHAGAG